MKHLLSLFLVFCLLIITNISYAEDLEFPICKSCYDGDTCKFDIPDVPDVFGKGLSIRIRGIDTPEIRGKCENEKVLAKKAKEFIADKGYDQQFGARPLNRALQKYLEDPIADVILGGLKDGDVLIAEIKDDDEELTIRVKGKRKSRKKSGDDAKDK